MLLVLHCKSFVILNTRPAMGQFADGHTSSTKIKSSQVEYQVGKTSKNIESSTRYSSTLELEFWGRVL